ncbi:hypothetical protein VTN77DRAFT_1886 [Rasamsonia byssochlamydoides]|uniref:uncharacterized protein n=1 Tax=Rasamsonia byssochlamydoides TaxID=89139 RepID=UPI00374298DE
MRFNWVAALSFLVSQTLAVPIEIQPGNSHDLIISSVNTVNGTSAGSGNGTTSAGPQSSAPLHLSIVNNFSGGSINAYVTGTDIHNNTIFLQPDGTFYYPDATTSTNPQQVNANIAIPIGPKGSTTKITLPDYISAGRVWFAEGDLTFFVVAAPGGGISLVEPSAVNPKDPSADINWGFVELTYTAEGGLYANISYVDFVGLILGMSLTTTDGSGTQTAKGLQPDAVKSICSALKQQAASDGQPWDQLCVTDSNGNELRVLSPTDYISLNPTAFQDYWTDYVDKVWTKYSSQSLTINTQASPGYVSCNVTGDVLACAGDNRNYQKPTAVDIFGCNSGPFTVLKTDNTVHAAVVPRLCAAFDRSTLLMPGGNMQPSLNATAYYTTSPTNYYSKFVHQYEIDGKGYAFAYDDVNPTGANEAGVVSSANPNVLTVTIGGPSS